MSKKKEYADYYPPLKSPKHHEKDYKPASTPGKILKDETEFEYLNTPFGKNVRMEIETAEEWAERSGK